MRYDFGITMRCDEKEYKKAKKILAKKGMTLPEAFRYFLQAVIREKGLPFTVTLGEKNGTNE